MASERIAIISQVTNNHLGNGVWVIAVNRGRRQVPRLTIPVVIEKADGRDQIGLTYDLGAGRHGTAPDFGIFIESSARRSRDFTLLLQLSDQILVQVHANIGVAKGLGISVLGVVFNRERTLNKIA